MIDQPHLPAIRVGSQPSQPRSSGQGRDIQQRATAGHVFDDPLNQRSLRRLAAAMSAEEPLRDDVPRGYYLDIVI